jgi:hypothetical protein
MEKIQAALTLHGAQICKNLEQNEKIGILTAFVWLFIVMMDTVRCKKAISI